MLRPIKLMGPDALVIELAAELARLRPALAWEPEEDPVREMVPDPAEITAVPLTLIPFAAAVVLAPPVPLSVMLNVPLVLIVPAVKETP